MNQVTMPWLSDARCKEKYPTANVTVAVCVGETGGNLDTCQVSIELEIICQFWFK